uniref:Small ribosomal subunit protein uS2c n=1 Tax=Gonium pectorale TaxID=33097 RepID=M1V1U9_GONPE|nr:ribosomal protein S2 [Gonium pectorale]BAM86001.1 ribosomal protein S2 [Gonium pectorale]
MIKTQKTKQLVNKQGIKAKLAKLVPGNLLPLKITAVGANNVGINEFSYGIPVLVPNAKLGDTVQVKILKILTTKKVAVAKLVKVLTNTQIKQENTNLPTLSSGTCLEVTITKLGPNSTGIADLPNTYNNVNKLIIKKPFINLGEKVTVIVTRVKKEYAFAVVNNSTKKNTETAIKISGKQEGNVISSFKGTKFTVVIPKKAKRYLKHIVFKVANVSTPNLAVNGFEQTVLKKGIVGVEPNLAVNKQTPALETINKLGTDTILFVKPSLGAKLGDKVQIQITKFFKINGTNRFIAIAKIIKLNPISATQKTAFVRASIRQMLKSGMHYGEKAIKCNARMKNYVWTRKKGTSLTSTSLNQLNSMKGNQFSKNDEHLNSNKLTTNFNIMTRETRPLIKKGRNVINLLKTRRCLNKALAQLTKYAVKGKTFLFVGTKKAASGLVSRAALFSKKAFFVNTRWLGGMLTNWKTILKSISKIRPILKEKQIIIKDILEKRQNIKTRLIQKALLLRKKSKLMLKKGRLLIQMFKSVNLNSSSNHGSRFLFNEKTNLLNTKRKEFVSKGILLLEKQRQLIVKRQEIILQSQTLKSKAIQLTNTYRQLLNNLISSRKKLRELTALLIVSKELQAFKQQAKQDNQNLYMVSYNKFKTLNANFIIKNPPKEILNKMVSIIKGQALIIKNNNLNLKSINKTKTLILSQLLSKFNLFVPSIKMSIKNLQTYISNLQISLNKVLSLLNTVKNKMTVYVTLKNKLVLELQKIKQTLQTERNILRVLRRKLKQISAQKRLIKFLPKLRYLATPATKIEQTARFLMKKFVDPKMKYPMDSIYDEKLNRQSKKVAASRKKKWQRLEKYLGGISNMTKIKEKQIRNNVAIIIGQQEEMNAVRECQKLGIKMFHIVDTNCNPGFADHFIPANDDARNSIKFILGKFLTRIRLAQKLKMKFKKAKKAKIKK